MAYASASNPSAVTVDAWRRRENLWPGGILLMLAALAWAYTLYRADAMGGVSTGGEMGDMRMAQDVNRLVDLGLFGLGWGVMMAAMMLPAVLPLILMYRTLARKRMPPAQGRIATVILVAGYLAVWTLVGLPVYAYEAASAHPGSLMSVLPGLLLIAGGAYQFTALKHGCHSRCSNPLMFLAQRWRPGVTGALRLGVLHGGDCLGCCVGLMLALVALGMMNLAWMLTAAVIIFAEKTLPGGHRIARPLGVLLVTGGIVLLGTTLLSGGMAM